MAKYNIITEIEGVKQYVRRVRRRADGFITITMLSGPNKAMDFGSLEKATIALNKMGIGKAIEVNE